MKKLYLYIIVTVVVLGTGGYFWLSNSSGKDVKYRTEKVTRGNIVVNVRATGTINPVQTVQVGSQVSGTISKIFVDYNSQVKKGQVIAIIDSTFLYASVKEAEANREHNQAQVNEAKRSFERTQELFKKDLVSQADLDAAKTSYESALAQLKQTQAALDRTIVNLRYAVIRAPIDGVVISRDVDVGQTVAASLQTPKLFEIANDLANMQVQASVDEADIGQINVGQQVSFTVDAYPDENFRGRVSQIRLAPITVQNVVTYTVVIDVPNPDLKLRPGMTATVSVLVDKREDVLRVPTLAVRFQPPVDLVQNTQQEKQADTSKTASKEQRDEHKRERGLQRDAGGQRQRDSVGQGSSKMQWMKKSEDGNQRKMVRLWILDNGKSLKSIMVSTGLNDNRYVEILGGDLKEGDEIVVGTLGGEMTSGPAQTNPFQTRLPGGGGRRGM